jgi:hypothetical protein
MCAVTAAEIVWPFFIQTHAQKERGLSEDRAGRTTSLSSFPYKFNLSFCKGQRKHFMKSCAQPRPLPAADDNLKEI